MLEFATYLAIALLLLYFLFSAIPEIIIAALLYLYTDLQVLGILLVSVLLYVIRQPTKR